MSTDPEHCFELALQIGNLTIAHALAKESNNPQKWSQLAEVATSQNKFDLVQECLTKANDFGSLLMLATCSGKVFPFVNRYLLKPILSITGDQKLLKHVGDEGLQQGKFNISFVSAFLLGNLEECLEILIQTNRIPEAAFFARYVFCSFYSLMTW